MVVDEDEDADTMSLSPGADGAAASSLDKARESL